MLNITSKLLHAVNLVILTGSIVACSSSDNNPKDNSTSQGQKQTLRVGSDLTYPPFAYFKDNQPAGFDIEFVKLLTQSTQFQPEFVDTRFANLIPGLNSKKFEVIASALYITPEREKQVNFIPYAKVGGVLIARLNENFAPQQPEDLCGKIVGSIKGASWIPRLEKVSQEYCLVHHKEPIHIREFETSPEALQSLLSKSTDVQFENSVVAKNLIEKVKNKTFVSSKDILYPEVIGLAIRKDDKATFEVLSTTLQELKKHDDYQKLLDQNGLGAPSS
ncbi:ABC transporter substrate-binding protein [Acinetobacter soli]|uniref:ABC transporter substrate-binding protein n=1 Tax=Acinetobacter soli TaxID=487316 RepID=UPI00124F86A7|nr:transporter substrate-binding domain-containing protein [Acinetobacter soli]MEB4799780.1 transporter substrate-binding domain-containing protein [Acinetobacter soli]